jgi:hypothetical protein
MLVLGKLKINENLYKPKRAVLTRNPLKYILKLPVAST